VPGMGLLFLTLIHCGRYWVSVRYVVPCVRGMLHPQRG
jgi:hypothetical protein